MCRILALRFLGYKELLWSLHLEYDLAEFLRLKEKNKERKENEPLTNNTTSAVLTKLYL